MLDDKNRLEYFSALSINIIIQLHWYICVNHEVLFSLKECFGERGINLQNFQNYLKIQFKKPMNMSS